MKDTQKIMIAALAGAAIGVIAGILLAPDKGSETRRKIAEAARKASENAQDLAASATSKFSELKNKVYDKKNEFVENHLS